MEFKELIEDIKREADFLFSVFQTKKITYEELLEQFKSDNLKIRLRALKQLAKRKEPEIPDIIINCLWEPPSIVTYEAEDILIKKGKSVVPKLLLAVGGNKETIRQSAVRILDSMGEKSGKLILNVLKKKKGSLEKLVRMEDPRLTPPLCEALKAGENSIRHSAAEALGKTGDPAGVPALIMALSDKNGWVKNAARDSLKSMGAKITQPVLDMMDKIPDESKHTIIDILGELADASLKPLFENFLNDDEPQIREAAVTAVGKLNLRSMGTDLLKALKDKDADVRRSAVLALGNSDFFMDEKEKYPDHILPLINDPDWKVRGVVAGILGTRGYDRGIPALTIALKDNDWQVRLAAVESLGKMGGDNIYDKVVLSTDDPVWIIRRAAVEALGNWGSASSLKTLQKTVKDENTDVRIASCIAAGKIGDPRFISILTETLSDKEAGVRAASAEALGAFEGKGDPRIIEPLIRLLKDSSFVARNSALITLGKFRERSAVESIMELMKRDEAKLRLQAIKTLGEIGDNRPVPYLVKILKTDSSLAVDVLISLGKIGDTMPLKDLTEYLPSLTDGKTIEIALKTIDEILMVNRTLPETKKDLVCSNCYHRFRQSELSIPGRNSIKFKACRGCMGSAAIEGIEKIVAIIDREMQGEFRKSGSTIEVNWLQLKYPFDFDEVKIIDGDDFDVERFVMTMRNDTDEERKNRMKSLKVFISGDVEISKNKRNLLEINFRVNRE